MTVAATQSGERTTDLISVVLSDDLSFSLHLTTVPLLVVVAAAIAGWLLWRWWSRRQLPNSRSTAPNWALAITMDQKGLAGLD